MTALLEAEYAFEELEAIEKKLKEEDQTLSKEDEFSLVKRANSVEDLVERYWEISDQYRNLRMMIDIQNMPSIPDDG